MNFDTIILLSEDIQQMIKEVYGEDFDILRLCRDHKNKVTLKDKNSVLDITQDDLVGVFDMKSNHYFLTVEQVLRFAIYCEVPISGIIGLILKAEWESTFAEILKNSGGKSASLHAQFKNKKLIEKYAPEFVPDKRKIINLFIDYGKNLDKDFQIDKVGFFIQDLLDNFIFLKGNNWISNHYTFTNNDEKTLLLGCSKNEKQNYFQLKELWNYKTDELSEYLFTLEKKKRIYTNLENRYLRIFGIRELKKIRWSDRVKKYKTILRLIQEYPDFSYRDLLKLTNEILAEINREKSELKSKINRSHAILDLSAFSEINSVVTDEFRNKYIAECKKLLRKLYMLLHSDTCPSYNTLSNDKKNQINELWLKLMKTTNGEMFSYSPTMLLYQYPDLSVLQSIYLRACNILGINPDNVEPADRLEFMINKGASFKKIIGFLNEEIENIDLHLAQLELVQTEFSHEQESEYYQMALENITEQHQKLDKEIDKLKDEVANLKKEIKLNLISENA